MKRPRRTTGSVRRGGPRPSRARAACSSGRPSRSSSTPGPGRWTRLPLRPRRAGVVALLASEPTIDIVGEGDDGRAAVELVERLKPDVALVDLRMPVLDGASATAEIVARHPGTRVLILTTYDTDAEIERAVEAGAIGYLLKDTTRDQLVDAIRSAARGETVLAPRVAERLVARMRRPAPVALTAREVEVLSAVADGLSNVEIGRRLVITEATVKTHLLRVFAKLDVRDRTHAVVVALDRGLLERREPR